MTFCVGIKVREGIVALADTRITRGSEQVNKQKLAQFVHDGQSLFTMTSGLRSVRDKTLTYLDETLRDGTHSIDRLYQFVNLFGEQLRRVKVEDGPSLAATNHAFNLNSVIGGQLSADVEPQLFYVYPEGNWVECNIDSPYFMIGRTYYGKPILDRLGSSRSFVAWCSYRWNLDGFTASLWRWTNSLNITLNSSAWAAIGSSKTLILISPARRSPST